jgi:RNase H-fold protein (predicted Holliday junction resolvase)
MNKLTITQKELVKKLFNELRSNFNRFEDLAIEIWDEHLSYDEVNFNLDTPENDHGDLDEFYSNQVFDYCEDLWSKNK